MKKTKLAIPFTPEWKGAVEGYVKNHLKANHWRVAGVSDHSDIMQEAYETFLRVAKRYPHVNNMRWFMALYKKAWHCRFYDLAKASSKVTGHETHPEVLPEGGAEQEGALLCLLREAPEELKEVFTIMFTAPREYLDEVERLVEGKYACGLNRYFHQLTGTAPKELNLMKAIKAYLSD